jgi:hypothetical protein
MARGRKSNPYSMLTKDEMETFDNLKTEAIDAKIAEIAKNDAALQEAKSQDDDLKQAKLEAKEAGLVYAEGAKANRQRIKYLRGLLNGRGKDDGDSGIDETTGRLVKNFTDSVASSLKEGESITFGKATIEGKA